MKKLGVRDRRKRLGWFKGEVRHLILSSIFRNLSFFSLIRWNAFSLLNREHMSYRAKAAISNRCVSTISKKRFNKTTFFSRHVFLKLVRSGQISGLKKSSW